MLPDSIYHPTMFRMLAYFGSQIQPEEGEEDNERLHFFSTPILWSNWIHFLTKNSHDRSNIQMNTHHTILDKCETK